MRAYPARMSAVAAAPPRSIVRDAVSIGLAVGVYAVSFGVLAVAAELPGLARVNSQFTMKMVKASASLRIDDL